MKKSHQSHPLPIKALTSGPKFHWFGYYDKLQFDPAGRYILGMEVDFEHRRPATVDTISVGLIDLHNNFKWTELGKSRAWCWQMGCMLQWRPGSNSQVIWNDRDGDKFICHILDVQSGKKQTLPFAFFSVHPSGKLALGLDFERLEYMRPGYGYSGVRDRNKNILAPEDMGVYLLDLETGRKDLLISLAQLAKIPDPVRDLTNCKHYCNCLLFNPDGSRFVFLHRWRTEAGNGWPFKTRMFSANADGSDLFVLVPGGCGHFNWRDNESLIVQENGFLIYTDKVGKANQIGKNVLPDSGGHVSYLPDKKWVVGDTYPNAQRQQQLYLYNTANNKMFLIGTFEAPLEYSGSIANNCDDEWRCDLHPRLSNNGQLITIDSTHGGNGRQIYLIDTAELLQLNEQGR